MGFSSPPGLEAYRVKGLEGWEAWVSGRVGVWCSTWGGWNSGRMSFREGLANEGYAMRVVGLKIRLPALHDHSVA